jgi:hypothetical protein
MSYEEKSKLQQENRVFLLFACISKLFLFYGARKGTFLPYIRLGLCIFLYVFVYVLVYPLSGAYYLSVRSLTEKF